MSDAPSSAEPAAPVPAAAAPAASPQQQPVAEQKPKSKRRLVIFGVILVVAAGAGGWWWYSNRNFESTDDAFIDGDAGSVAPRIAGTIAALHVTDNQFIHAGDPIVDLDPADETVALTQAKANLAAAQANLALTKATVAATLDQAISSLASAEATISSTTAQANSADALAVRAIADVARAQSLVRTNDTSKQNLDAAVASAKSTKAQAIAAHQQIKVAETERDTAKGKLAEAETGPQQIAVQEAAVAQAQAAVDNAALQLSYTKIVAPRDGTVTQRAVNIGDQVQRGQTIASLVFSHPWVTANFKETQLDRMRLGQPVKITVDALNGRVYHGHVDSIMRGTGSRFALLPTENATGNYVKVVQRVPVKIVFDDLPPEDEAVLGLGLSVVPSVDVSGAAQ